MKHVARRTALAAAALAVSAAALPASALAATPGTTPAITKDAVDQGAAPSQTEHLTLALKLRHEQGLDARLARPGAAPLTPAKFTAAFGPAPATVRAVTRWARQAGLQVDAVSPNRTLVELSGSTGSVDRALGTSTHLFRAADGSTFRSATGTATVPRAFADRVAGITGLSSLGRLRLKAALPTPALPRTFGPKQLSSFYGAPSSATGSGQTVGVIAEGALTQVQKDLRTFEAKFGLPQVPVTVTGPGSADTAGQDEYDLDTQYASSQAPGAAGLRIYDGKSLANGDILSAINLWATEGTVKTASFSAGECEILAAVTGLTAGLDQVLKQAAAQGQSLFVSSGDNGGYCTALVNTNGLPGGVPGVEYPSSSPYAVAVGGTTVLGTAPAAGRYTAETAWIAGGGGLSDVEPKPAYQPAPAVARRGVPDVALDADPITGYQVVVSGQVETIGGTSASAPAWNGFWARALGARGALGFAGPRLYAAKTGFHDIVTGTNGLHVALPGYDLTTGLGTPNLGALIPAL